MRQVYEIRSILADPQTDRCNKQEYYVPNCTGIGNFYQIALHNPRYNTIVATKIQNQLEKEHLLG